MGTSAEGPEVETECAQLTPSTSLPPPFCAANKMPSYRAGGFAAAAARPYHCRFATLRVYFAGLGHHLDRSYLRTDESDATTPIFHQVEGLAV